MSEDLRYGFAVGKIRMLELGLLRESHIERMFASPDAEVAFQALEGTAYGVHARGVSAGDIDEVLSRVEEETVGVVRSLTEDPDLTDALLSYGDFHNLTVILKARLLGRSGEVPGALAVRWGKVSPEAIEFIVETATSKEGQAPARFKDPVAGRLFAAAESVVREYRKEEAARLIDFILEREYLGFLIEASRSEEQQFLEGLARRQADIANILAFSRVARMSGGKELDSRALVRGGFLPATLFSRGASAPGEIIERLRGTRYEHLAAEIRVPVDNQEWLPQLERACDNLLVRYAGSAKGVVFGLEPVIAYFLVRRIEAKTVRVIISGKIAGIPDELLEHRVRETYYC